MTKILLVGDLHLGKPLLMSTLTDAISQQVAMLKRMESIAIREGCRHALMLGDLYDNARPSQELLVPIIDFLAASKLKWIIYPGNHDVDDVTLKKDEAESVRSSLKLLARLPKVGLRNVQFVQYPQIVNVDGARIYVIPWGHAFDVPKNCDVVAFHDSLVGARRDNGHQVPEGKGILKKQLRGKPAVSGHLHTPQKVGNVLFPGTPAQTSWGEKPNKCLFYMSVVNGRVNFRRLKWRAPWKLLQATWTKKGAPPIEKEAYYTLKVDAGTRPDAEWMTNNKNVVRFGGLSKKSMSEIKTFQERTTDMEAWLGKNTSLSPNQIQVAVKIDGRI